MKKLIIVTHPDIENSKINRRWVDELEKAPEKYTIHQLYKVYPDEQINVLAEQELLKQYDTIVFQFPVYWHSCPPLLKKWTDEVLIHGWAYGSKSGYQVSGKKIALAMSAGVEEYEYAAGEKYKYTLKELTRPFELTWEYVRADYQPFFVYYGMEFRATAERIEKSMPRYIDFLEAL